MAETALRIRRDPASEHRPGREPHGLLTHGLGRAFSSRPELLKPGRPAVTDSAVQTPAQPTLRREQAAPAGLTDQTRRQGSGGHALAVL